MRPNDELNRSLRGAEWGLAATAVMTIAMAIGALVLPASFARPPFPMLFVDQLAPGAARGLRVAVAFAGHAAFGTFVAILFAYLARPMTLGKGALFSLLLWFAMQTIAVPWLGWADFGLLHSGSFGIYTLVLHLLYGATLGALGARDDRQHHVRFDVLGRLLPLQSS